MLTVGVKSFKRLLQPRAYTRPLSDLIPELDLFKPLGLHDRVWRGRYVEWVGPDEDVVEVPARYVRMLVGNIMDAEKLSAFYWLIHDATDEGHRVRLPMTFGYVGALDETDIRESLEAEACGRLDELGLDEPWTTGDDDVDAYLRSPEDFIEDRGYEFVELPDDLSQAEERRRFTAAVWSIMRTRLLELKAAGAGDFGKYTVQLRDGHHRVFAALAMGEPTIFVRGRYPDGRRTTGVKYEEIRQTLRPRQTVITPAEIEERMCPHLPPEDLGWPTPASFAEAEALLRRLPTPSQKICARVALEMSLPSWDRFVEDHSPQQDPAYGRAAEGPASLLEIGEARTMFQDNDHEIDDDAQARRPAGPHVWIAGWVWVYTNEEDDLELDLDELFEMAQAQYTDQDIEVAPGEVSRADDGVWVRAWFRIPRQRMSPQWSEIPRRIMLGSKSRESEEVLLLLSRTDPSIRGFVQAVLAYRARNYVLAVLSLNLDFPTWWRRCRCRLAFADPSHSKIR